MPKKVYCNVEDHRMLDGGTVVEDVTKVGLPTIKHAITSVNAAGMVMAVEMPNLSRLEAADYTIYHNNGVHCKRLSRPGKHTHEFRTVRQRYNVAKGRIEHESVKYRMIGVHAETQKGDIETDSPFGSTEKYSLLRYEEEIDGKVTTVVDAMAGIFKHGDKEYIEDIENLLK